MIGLRVVFDSKKQTPQEHL